MRLTCYSEIEILPNDFLNVQKNLIQSKKIVAEYPKERDRFLKMLEGCPVGMARIALKTALKALERHSFVSLKDFEIELKELDKNG